MKHLLFVIFSFLAFTYFAQSYRAPKAQVMLSAKVPASSEEATFAWFLPRALPYKAKQFEKVEFGVKLPASLEHRMRAFLRNDERIQDRINPFDRHDIDITTTFQVNGEVEKIVDAFYFEEYRRDLANNSWRQDTTSFPFRVRFSPATAGFYTVEVAIEAKGFPRVEASFQIFVEPSEHKGFLERGSNYRHFRYTKTKESFYGVGQVIPWAEYEDWTDTGKESGPVKFMPLYQAMRNLSNAGGNFTRFIAAPWFMQLEWEALGNYQPKMDQAWEFDRMNDRCDELKMYYIFCALLHAPFESKEDDKQTTPGVRWEDYCYNDADRSPSKYACKDKLGLKEPVDFFSNDAAFDCQQNYFRYLVSRWGYSTSLAAWQLVSETDQVHNYRDEKDANGNVIDHSDVRKKVNIWAGKMAKYMRQECNDPRPNSISFILGKEYSSYMWDPDIFKYDEMEFIGLHDYVLETELPTKNIRNRNLIQRYGSVNVLSVGLDYGRLWHPEFQKKMYIYDEFGQTVVIPRKWPEDKDDDPVVDYNNCTDFMFKQDLWFTLSSGCAIAGLDWWNEDEPLKHKQWDKYLPGMVRFIKDIDYERRNYAQVRQKKRMYYIAQRWPFSQKDIERSNSRNYRRSDKLEAYIQVDSLGKQGFGWMANRSFHRGNLVDSMECLAALTNGTKPFDRPYLYEPADNDVVDKPITIEERGAFIKVYNVARRTRFKVDFYNTETGEVITTRTFRSSGGGTLKIFSPIMIPSEHYDFGFKFYDEELGWNK